VSVLTMPAVAVPEYVITREETLDLCERLHSRHPDLELVLRLIRNTGVQKRHLIRPIEEILHHPGFEERNRIYEHEAKMRVPPVVRAALANAGIGASEIDLLIYVSCTGFMMPSMTAWLINDMDFRFETRQLPIAQLGCAAGSAAINRAHDFCKAYPTGNVLIVACEFSSLCYQPTDVGIGSLLSNGLFGDAVAAVVMRGEGASGVRVEANGSYLMPDTVPWIRFDVKASGFHFMLDRRVPKTMEGLAPALRSLAGKHGRDASRLDFYVIHAGGPRILDDLAQHLDVTGDRFSESRATLTEYGNIASAVVLETLRRMWESGRARPGANGVIAGFGPGITAEMSLGTWVTADTETDTDLPFNCMRESPRVRSADLTEPAGSVRQRQHLSL
jgi:1,3,6,8-tetrahydroxynaphthalene synthase